jgi:hypothetical protein
MLSRKLEDAVNAAVRAKTTDPVLFIVNHLIFMYLRVFFIWISNRILILRVYDDEYSRITWKKEYNR